jgi:hypothetical protein
MSAAQTGRTHDLHPTASRKPKESLDPWAPSTHDPTATFASISFLQQRSSFLTPSSSPRQPFSKPNSKSNVNDAFFFTEQFRDNGT